MPESDKNIEKKEPLPPPGVQVEIWGEIFSGPIPPPQTLQEFEKAVPGSADRILIMAENEQKHHHKIETLREKLPFISTLIGQLLGFIMGMSFIGGGIFLLYLERNIAGYASLGTGIVSLLGPMIAEKISSSRGGRKRQPKKTK